MLCYRDKAYCEDACLCSVPEKDCFHKLTIAEGHRAATLGLPISWMSFKDICTKYKAVSCPPTK